MASEEKKKRKSDNLDEIEVNLEEPEPLSKKQKRLLKKGKDELSEAKKRKLKKSQNDDTDLHGDKEETKQEETGKPKKGEFSAWIGNLTFETTKEDLRRFLVAKSEVIQPESITRINLPKNDMKKGKCKGFAYVDFSNQDELDACIALSETNLSGRNVLIKNAKSFEGRPDRPKSAMGNPPSRILFVGNLAFDTTEENLEYQFQHCGEIVKIRMATFEDSGNCKGFAFVDFMTPEQATKALNDKRCKRLNGRTLRMEYGEDRSKRTRNEKHGAPNPTESNEERPQRTSDNAIAEQVLNNTDTRQHRPKPHKRNESSHNKPGLALAHAQRGKIGIAESTGKKITF